MLIVCAFVSGCASPSNAVAQETSNMEKKACKKSKKKNYSKNKESKDSDIRDSKQKFRSNRAMSRNERLDLIAKKMNLKPNQVVADIGAGRGIMTWRFAKAVGSGGKAIGIEVRESLVERMNEDAKDRNLPNYEAKLVPTDDPKLEANSTDVIFLKHAYHHISNRIPYFSNVKSALKSGGRLIIVDFSETSESFHRSTEDLVTKKQLVDELKQAGYKLIKEHDVLLPKDYFLEFEVAN